MKSLPISTYCALVTSATCNHWLGLFHNYFGYYKGKSILSTNQSLAFEDSERILCVDFCSPGEWKPYEENDNNEDEIWFGSMDDVEELEDNEFLDSKDGWF
eukprot:7932825-Ditylum_brightwellii.AAC.1